MLAALLPASLQAQNATTGATFGTIVALGGTPSDIVIDEGRGRLYLVNSNANRVDIYDYNAKRLTGQIRVGTFPLAAALSPDGAYLYVTNTQSSTLSVVDLSFDGVVQTVSLPARPEGVAVGGDGRVLITTQGAGTGNTLNTLLIFDRSQTLSQQVIPVSSPPPISTPNPLPPVFLGRPATPFPGRLLTTPDGNFIIGMVAINQTLNTAQTTLFVYEVASGVVLRNRTVTGQSTVLSVSPDGSRFMAGSTLYDTSTLGVIAQQNTANLPFFIGTNTVANPNFNLQANFGGSVFSPEGDLIYAAFNTAATGTRTTANALLVSNSRHLGTRLGIRLPQSILGRMIATSDGTNLFALSESGMLHLPIGNLADYPMLQTESNQVFLAIDDCNKGLAKVALRVLNAGKGKLTFSVPSVTTALVTRQTSGVVPTTVEFVMEPGRSGVTRQAGTNLFTNAAGGTGTPINVTLSSPEAINFPNTIRVYMNFRQSDQRGIIHPRPTVVNNTQGLQEMLLDSRRNRIYISNAGFNRIEVFDIGRQRFVDPIEVGQLPRSMAMSLDGGLLYVGNTGGESISVVDLETGRLTGNIEFPPIPRAGNQNSLVPAALAMTLSGLQFMMQGPTNSTFWRLLGNQAVPRIGNAVTPATVANPPYLSASPDGQYLLALAGNGVGYLYDALIDNYTVSRQIYDQTPISYFAPVTAAPNANFFIVSGLVLNSALAVIGGSERPGQTIFTPGQGPGQPPIQQTVSAGQRNVASTYATSETSFARLTTPVRQNPTAATRDDARPTLELVDTLTGAQTIAGVVPDSPQQQVFGTARVNVPGRQLVVDSSGTAYAITLSGLTVMPLSGGGAEPARPQIRGGAAGITNANDGSRNYRPGSFIAIDGQNLAGEATAEDVPLPTLLGGSCVAIGDVAVPLIETSSGRILAQIPADANPGQNILQVRSLNNGAQSEPVLIQIQRPE
jgi:YVTN family beta-propeller protein